MAQTNEPGTKPRPGVLLGGEPRNYSAKALQLQTLTDRGIRLNVAELLAPFVWEGRASG